MATVTRPGNRTLDTQLSLKAEGLVAASAASATIVDLGASTPSDATPPLIHGEVMIDVSAIEIASNDEIYTIILQGSDSATFASGIEELGSLRLGANEVLTGDVDSDTGRYFIPFTNQSNTRRYRYVRVYTLVAGSVATGINYTADAVLLNR